MEYLGARGTLIHEKKLKSKISCQTPFNTQNWALCASFPPIAASLLLSSSPSLYTTMRFELSVLSHLFYHWSNEAVKLSDPKF
jgi:hypothetical protein